MAAYLEREKGGTVAVFKGDTILFKTRPVKGFPLPFTMDLREAKINEISKQKKHIKLEGSWYYIKDIWFVDIIEKKKSILEKWFL